LVGVGDPDGRSAAHKPVATVRQVGEPEEADMTTTPSRRLRLVGGLAPVVGLLVLSPIAAEYHPHPGLGISAGHLGFVAGFMIMTIAAPIAVVEAFVPDRADRPWLGRTGLTVIGLLYLLGAGFVFAYDTRPRGFLIAPAQLIGTAPGGRRSRRGRPGADRHPEPGARQLGRGRHERGGAGPAGWAAAGLVPAVGLGAASTCCWPPPVPWWPPWPPPSSSLTPWGTRHQRSGT
jgi:hypothetical protein